MLTGFVQGAGGGPNEYNVTGLLVKSTSKNWGKGSVLAVDAGVHLAAIIKILEEHLPRVILQEPLQESINPTTQTAISVNPAGKAFPTEPIHSTPYYEHFNSFNLKITSTAEPTLTGAASKRVLSSGPFAGLELPCQSAKANGAYIIRHLVSTYLISHPHLDHVSGFAVNTASFLQGSQPKRLAALPSTINAIKHHIFNDIIWPNLSDENNGVGLVTYMRLVEGGINDYGNGEGKGYLEVCDGLAVKCWSVSHGQCMKSSNYNMNINDDVVESKLPQLSPKKLQQSLSRSILEPEREKSHSTARSKICAYDSSAFFLRDDCTGKQLLIFGDVEPDSLSLSPRTAQVWGDAAPMVVAGVLSGVFIECSYDDSRSNETLFGHLSPRHLIAELRVLAEMVTSLKKSSSVDLSRKRKRHSDLLKSSRDSPGNGNERKSQNSQKSQRRLEELSVDSPVALSSYRYLRSTRNKSVAYENHIPEVPSVVKDSYNALPPINPPRTTRPLEGLQIIIMHVKDTLRDGPEVSDTIMAQLRHHEEAVQLGCVFSISKAGTSIWL